MRQRAGRFAALFFSSLVFLVPGRASAAVLNIPPLAQQTPDWCFAASSAMILQYLGYPDLSPINDYQCAVVGAQGGSCLTNCYSCPGAGGTIQHIAALLQTYAGYAMIKGYVNPGVHLNESGILSPQQIIGQIDGDGPILAGVSPGQIPYPPGLGVSQHAVVIVGYEGDASNFNLVVNDPYPYSPPSIPKLNMPVIPSPYLAAGGILVQLGQYKIPYQAFVGLMGYGNSLTFR